ncbi:PucR family transcriptional regulator [Pseudonocardia sp. H11422]|uniref:PucR family transcriptional regulator n=1 Tax=Pseudonocardia sp. H11422 TaxID=2835866 RepID=UPI001BDCDC6F|nr:helix-turn-helix domain-containing protein [Pseudonocardia sp. H11422]
MASDGVTTSRVVADVARELEGELPALSSRMASSFLNQIPKLQGDDAVTQLVVASTASNLSTVVDVLQHGIPLDQISVPAAAAAHARRFAQRDLPVEALLRAYRLGEGQFVQWCLRSLATRSLDAAELLAAVQEITSVAARYIDQVCEHLVDIYETERRLWGQRTDAARAASVRTVLDDETIDVGTAEAMIGSRLRGWHVAAVAWLQSDSPDAARRVEPAAAVLAEAYGRSPLTVLIDDHTLWAWVSGTSCPRLDEQALDRALTSHPDLHLALGEPAADLTGFRSSHREALNAKAVAQMSGDETSRVTSFATVSISALLLERLDEVRTWVARTLGDLARDDEAMAKLRDTVRIFLQTGGSFTDAASRLHLHKNTVHYRVRKAEEIRGRPLGDGRLDVEVALVLCRQLGPDVLTR